MKPKNFSKKLMLNKKTIAHLDIEEIKLVYGGTADTADPCAIPVTGTECPIQATAGACITFGRYSCPTICYTNYPGYACNPWAC